MTQQVQAPPITTATSETVRKIAGQNCEQDWLFRRRGDAWRAYESLDLPDPYDEEWRRTDVRGLDLSGLAPDLSDGPPSAADADLLKSVSPARLAGALQIDDLEERVSWLDGELEKQKVRFGLLSGGGGQSKSIESHLYSVVPVDEWKYLALNAALWRDGCILYVPDNVEIDLPFHYLRESMRSDVAIFPRTLIVLGRNARASLIEEMRSSDGSRAFVSGAVEIVLGDGAKFEYYDVNRWGDEVYNFKTVRAVLGRDAHFTGLAAGIGSKMTKMRVDAEMPQSGARTDLLGVTFGDGDQHFDYNTLQNHLGDHTSSDLQFKSALTDSASLVWYGITRIHPEASGSEANQTSRNLLLSEHAKASPIPVLEIEAYDVAKCSHGATAGPVDEDDLFYLQSRAIPRDVAEQMLVGGFFADVIDRVPNERLRARIVEAVLRKAGGGTPSPTFEDVLSA